MLSLMGAAGVASAQQPPATPAEAGTAAPAAAPPAAAPPAAQPTAEPPADPATAPPADASAAQPTDPSAAPAAEGAPAPGAEPPPPPSYSTDPPGQPPPPRYGPLAPEPEPEVKEGDWDPWAHSPSHRRHDGFFLRIALGVGWGAMSTEGHILEDIDKLDLSGIGMGMSIGIGGALTDNLILYGDIFQTTIFSPEVEVDGQDVGDADSLAEDVGIGVEARIAGLGIGLNYYFMPANLYVGGSIGFGQAVFEDGPGDVDGSDLGLGIDLIVGKEWWVGNDWGLGIAAQVLLLDTEDVPLGDITGQAFNVLFSATYN